MGPLFKFAGSWQCASHLTLTILAISAFTFTGCEKRKPYGYNDPDRVKTAEELLAILEENTPAYEREARPVYLEGDELTIVEDKLKERYPKVSLRDRLHFQIQPKPVVRIPKGEGRMYQDGFFSQRSRALRDLHSSEVHEFINRAGQGLERMPQPIPQDLKNWDSSFTTKIDTQPLDTTILGEALIELPSLEFEKNSYWPQPEHYQLSDLGLPKKQLVEFFHTQRQNEFADPDSLGYVENVDSVAGFESHQIHGAYLNTLRGANDSVDTLEPIAWKTNRFQLVGLTIHAAPVAYVSENLPNMEELRGDTAETRRLSDFEMTSLEELKKGEDVVIMATKNRIQMLGALRASAQCLECHTVKRDQVLGAFSYEFIRQPFLSSDAVIASNPDEVRKESESIRKRFANAE
ncbi:MAG: hypothetical protein AB8B55_17880 [Mariniblastus sp.]